MYKCIEFQTHKNQSRVETLYKIKHSNEVIQTLSLPVYTLTHAMPTNSFGNHEINILEFTTVENLEVGVSSTQLCFRL